MRRYLGDSVADRIPSMSFDDLSVILEQAALARSYLREDLSSIRRA